MSPELLKIMNGLGSGEFNPELSDIFSLGITFLRVNLKLKENEIEESKLYVFNKYLDWIDEVKESIQKSIIDSKEKSITNVFGRKINFSDSDLERKNLLFNNVIQSTAADIALSALSKIQEYL